jgi:hypothetical protein
MPQVEFVTASFLTKLHAILHVTLRTLCECCRTRPFMVLLSKLAFPEVCSCGPPGGHEVSSADRQKNWLTTMILN